MRLRSFKLRYVDSHVRIVPATDATGCVFAGPGVDLRGDDAQRVFTEATKIASWFTDREPGAKLRTFSLDLESGRALATVEDSPRPRVIVSHGDPELRAAADEITPLLCSLAAQALDRRR
jgi:hypothetical protein